MDKVLLAELEWVAFEHDIPLDSVIEDFNRTNTHLRDSGSDSLVKLYTNDTPGQSIKPQTVNILKKIAREKGIPNKDNKRNTKPNFKDRHK